MVELGMKSQIKKKRRSAHNQFTINYKTTATVFDRKLWPDLLPALTVRLRPDKRYRDYGG